MGWGEAIGPARPAPARTVVLRLLDAIRAWEEHPSSNNTEAMLAAARDLDARPDR